jgi:DNA-binding NarL/FixJ family response regulator
LRRIIVCSRHAVLIAGLRSVVAEPAELGVIACPEPAQLTDLLANIQPDTLLLIDVAIITTLNSIAELKPKLPGGGVILWVDWISPEFVREALHAGVRGILRKDCSAEQYIDCFRQVSAQQLWLENDLNQKLLSGKSVRLSPRERQLIHLLTEGLRNKEIAGRMNITEGTTKAYLSRLFEKTGASDRFELAMFALRNLETNPAAGPSRGPRIFLPLRSVFARRA